MAILKTQPAAEKVGARVRRLRVALGMTGTKLAKLVGQAPSTLSDFEHGESEDNSKLDLYALHLKTNTHYLRTGRGDPGPGAVPETPWPFDTIRPDQVNDLTRADLEYLERRMRRALKALQQDRQQQRKHG